MLRLLLYCTKSNKQLFYDIISQKYMYGLNGKNDNFNSLNGKIVAECDFEVEEITNCGTSFMIMKYDDLQESYRYTNKIARGSCLNYTDLRRYLGVNNGYAIHIKNLNIFTYPMDFTNIFIGKWIKNEDMEINIVCDSCLTGKCEHCYNHYNWERCRTAPKNMMYVYNGNKKYILISIRPEWICKILNGEKTIEVRKKVLKEMINNA